MRLVKVSAPRGRAADIARLAFEQGISDVTLQQVERQKAGQAPEPRDTIDAKVSTSDGKAFIDAVIAAPFFNRHEYAIEIREPRSILKETSTRDITRPVPAPIVDIDEELWQFTHITYSFVLRVFIASLLLSYGMAQNNVLFMIGGLLFLPFNPLILACSFGSLTGQWKLVGHAVLALIAAIALIFAGGLVIAMLAEGPVLFDEFPPMIAGFAFSIAVGIASSLATADDVGRRELVGLAAASQLALIPAWFGLSLMYGFDGTEIDKLKSFGVNIFALVLGALAVYGFMFARGELSHAAARRKEAMRTNARMMSAVRLFKLAANRQIQIETDAGVHTVFVKSSNPLTPVDREATEAEYAALAKYAVASGEAPYYIRDGNSTTFVPLFLPGR